MKDGPCRARVPCTEIRVDLAMLQILSVLWEKSTILLIVVVVGKEVHKSWSMAIPEKAAPVTGTTLRITGPVPADSRQ